MAGIISFHRSRTRGPCHDDAHGVTVPYQGCMRLHHVSRPRLRSMEPPLIQMVAGDVTFPLVGPHATLPPIDGAVGYTTSAGLPSHVDGLTLVSLLLGFRCLILVDHCRGVPTRRAVDHHHTHGSPVTPTASRSLTTSRSGNVTAAGPACGQHTRFQYKL
jgi:hypothetical protein